MADSVNTDEARQRMIAKRFGGRDNVRTGGKGTVRRKKKAVHKTATSDDKKLTSTLKKLGVTPIPGIEEVNLFKENGEVIHFSAPKVQASIAANTYVVSGNAETKQLQELLPGIIHQLGPDNLQNLKQLAEQYSAGFTAADASHMAHHAVTTEEDEEDDEVPELVENFEEASKK